MKCMSFLLESVTLFFSKAIGRGTLKMILAHRAVDSQWRLGKKCSS
jgi:hypothetical protein